MGSTGSEEKWIKHYSSRHKLLLLGEGDFSFALCLATAFANASNIVATSLDSQEMLAIKHPTAAYKLVLLKDKGCTVMDNVDACSMSNHHLLWHRKFDRVVFNFPHAGFIMPRTEQLPSMNVVRGFLRNAYQTLTEEGEVHMTPKTSFLYSEWKIEKLGQEAGFMLTEKAYFFISDYPGYINKRGDGYRSNDGFPVGRSCTFKFAKN